MENFDQQRKVRKMTLRKPKFKKGQLCKIIRAGFPGSPIGTVASVLVVIKGKKRDGYAHRYEIVTNDKMHLWVYEDDIE